MEIEIAGDNIKMKDVLGKITEYSFNEITDIQLSKRRELFFTIGEKKIRALNTYNNFEIFLKDA